MVLKRNDGILGPREWCVGCNRIFYFADFAAVPSFFTLFFTPTNYRLMRFFFPPLRVNALVSK
jgi:hypothetical protein